MKTLLISLVLIIFFSLNCYADSDSTSNNYNSAGITIGHPGGVNLHYGSQISDPTEIYLFAGAWFSGSYGLKSSLQFKFHQTGNLKNYLTFNAGIKRTNEDHSRSFWSRIYSSGFGEGQNELSYFIGPGYALKWNWFMLTCDILIGNKSYRNPKLDLSLGYTYSF